MAPRAVLTQLGLLDSRSQAAAGPATEAGRIFLNRNLGSTLHQPKDQIYCKRLSAQAAEARAEAKGQERLSINGIIFKMVNSERTQFLSYSSLCHSKKT